MLFVFWINKAAETHSGYVVLIFPRKRWRLENASVLR